MTTLFEEEPAHASATRGMAVDEAYVYFTGQASRRLARVPKAGGPREVTDDGAFKQTVLRAAPR